MTLKVALIVLLMGILLTGCMSQRIKTEYVYPPDTLIQDCPVPPVEAKTWGDLPPIIVDLKAALANCNTDKAALRDWKHAK